MRLTKATVETLETRPTKWVAWDDKVRGLGVAVYPSGDKSWVLDYRTKDKKQRRQTIGRADVLHPDTARQMAREVLVAVAKGSDPLAEQRIRVAEPTISDLEAAFTPEHNKKVKGSTQAGNKSLWNAHILPRLGKKKVKEVTEGDIARLLDQLEEIPTTANRCIRLLSKAYNHARRRAGAWEWPAIASNPCRGAELYPENKVERYLDPEELKRFMAALDAWPVTPTQRRFAAMLRLLLTTGCRRGEIATARWSMVDFDEALLVLPDSKTGAKEVHLPPDAIVVLRELYRTKSSEWVIEGDTAETPISGFSKLWTSFLAHAQIKGLRIHDLRHNFASFAVDAKLSLPEIGGLMGHKSPQTTARYAHLKRDTGRAASAAVAAVLSSAMK